MLVLGAGLAIRFAHWAGGRRRRWIDVQIRHQIESGSVASEALKRSRAISEAVEWAAVALVYFVVAIVAFDRLGIPLTTLVAPATVVGIGLGFGAQQMVGDLLAGFFLFAERQFAFGDLIRLSVPGQSAGITGTVEELTLRVTKLRTQQGELVVVPNSALRQVTNLSKDWSRAVIDIPVSVTEDLEAVTTLLRGVVDSMSEEPAWRGLLLGTPVVAGVETIDVGYVQLRLIARYLARTSVRGRTRDPASRGNCVPGRGCGVTGGGRRRRPGWSVSGRDASGDPTRPRPPGGASGAGTGAGAGAGLGAGLGAVTGEEPEEDDGDGVGSNGDRSGVPHSALVGFMSVPVHRSLPIRRSTLLMIVAFLGFGALWYAYPPSNTVVVPAGSTVVIPGVTTVTRTTTATVLPATTTTVGVATTTTRAPASTTTSGPTSATTVAGSAPSTTTTRPSSGSTTTTSGAGGTSTSSPTTVVP